MLRIGKAFSKHAGAISAFDREFVHKGLLPRELSFDLHKVFELRQDHDYKIISNPSVEEAKITLNKAERFVSPVKQYLADHPDNLQSINHKKD